MPITIKNDRTGFTGNKKKETANRVTTVEKKISQMRGTLKKHPIPFDLIEK